jgi:transglutaminase-like putative cysteine protease
MNILLVTIAWAEIAFLDLVAARSFRAVHRAVAGTPVASPSGPPSDLSAVVDAVKTAGALYFKRVYCLQRAAAVTRLLRRRGIAATLVIGYRPSPIESHAWVEVDGCVVSEFKPGLSHYVPLDRW